MKSKVEENEDLDRFSKVAELYVRACETDISIAESKLNFSIWVAALATAGLGILITKPDSVLKHSCLQINFASFAISGIELAFVLSIICAGLVQMYIHSYLGNVRDYITSAIAQIASVLQEPELLLDKNYRENISKGEYLSEEGKAYFIKAEDKSERNKNIFPLLLKIETRLVGFSYVGLFFIASPYCLCLC